MIKEESLTTYLSLCTEVYDLDKPNPPQDEYALYREFVAQAKGKILEPMCGSGRFLLPLVKEGFKIDGFDASQHMLDALYAHAKQQNIDVHVWQSLISDFQPSEQYDLIFIPSGSFGLITDTQEASQALELFYKCLQSGGKLVFTAETLYAASKQVGIWRGSIYQRSDGKQILASFLDLPLIDDVARTICRYELIDHNQIIKIEIEDFKVRLYQIKKLTEMLHKTGFKKIKLLKAYEHNVDPDLNDAELVFECEK